MLFNFLLRTLLFKETQKPPSKLEYISNIAEFSALAKNGPICTETKSFKINSSFYSTVYKFCIHYLLRIGMSEKKSGLGGFLKILRNL